MTSTDLSIGKYKVIALSSISSNVYLAEHPTTALQVSITIWRAVHLDSKEKYDAFVQEAQALVQLRHPYIVSVLDFGVEGDVPYIVTEALPSTYSTLHEYIKRPLQEILSLLTEIGRALEYAHQHNILHRQLLPECILINAEGHPLLTSFGLATILSIAPPPLLDQIRLYPYTAPEQLQGDGECSTLSDQYALGCIAYELLTGQQPWRPLQWAPQLSSSLPGHIESAILKATASYAMERYEDMNAFLVALSTSAFEAPTEGAAPVAAQGYGSATNESSRVESPFYDRVSEEEMTAIQGTGVVGVTEVKDGDKRNTYSSPIERKRIASSKWLAVIALIMLLISSLGSASFLLPALQPTVPAYAATITITPVSKRMTNVYTIGLVTGIPDAGKHQIGARFLSFTSTMLSKTVKATGQGYQSATNAKGALTFSQAERNLVVNAGQVLSDARGIQVAIDTSFTLHVGESVAVPAHAVKAGASGNIPANDINATYNVIDNLTHQVINSVHIQNTNAFTNGLDAYSYTFVQQSDIDAAESALVNQLSPRTKLVVERQLRPHEQFADAIVCTPTVKADHKANDSATQVMVSVSVTCTGEAYSPAQVRALAASLLMSDVAARLGTHYALVGNVQTSAPTIQKKSARDSINLFHVVADGIWAFQFNADQQQTLAQSIAGKPQREILALLRKQEGVHDVSINTLGWLGSALPASPSAIKFIIINITGLQ